MTSAQQTELEMVFRFALRLPEDVALSSIRREQWSDWDSMAQVSLISAIEGQFDLVFSAPEAMQINSWDSCVAIVGAKLTK